MKVDLRGRYATGIKPSQGWTIHLIAKDRASLCGLQVFTVSEEPIRLEVLKNRYGLRLCAECLTHTPRILKENSDD